MKAALLDQEPAPAADYVVLSAEPASPVAVVCFHFAGGSAQSFFRWRQAAAGCDLIAAELPGRGRRRHQAFAPSLMEAAVGLADGFTVLAESMPGKRWVFFGHSLGALVAFETTRALRAGGVRGPDRLIVSAWHGPGSGAGAGGLPELSDAALTGYLHRLQGTPQAILENGAIMGMALPILRADLALIHGHRHSAGAPLDLPIEAIGASEDDRVPLEPLLAWGEATSGDFRLRMVPGGHFAMLDRPDILFDAVRGHQTGNKDGAGHEELYQAAGGAGDPLAGFGLRAGDGAQHQRSHL